MIIVFSILAGGYLIAAILLSLFQEKLIFLDEVLDPAFQYRFVSEFEEINLITPDDGSINALHFKTENPRGIIIYYHGNAGTLERWGHIADDFLKYGYDVAVMDYRGYGKSTGKRTQKTLLQDAVSFYDHFIEEFGESRMVPYGRSMGTGMASWVASVRKPKAVILETPYYTLTSLVQSKFPVFPAGPALRFKFNSKKYLESASCKVHIFHGTEDIVVPFRHGKKLYDHLGPEKASLYAFEGGRHSNLGTYESFWEEIEKILN